MDADRNLIWEAYLEGKKPYSPIGPDPRPKDGTPAGEEYATRHITPGPERERELKRRKEARENKPKEEGTHGFDDPGRDEEIDAKIRQMGLEGLGARNPDGSFLNTPANIMYAKLSARKDREQAQDLPPLNQPRLVLRHIDMLLSELP